MSHWRVPLANMLLFTMGIHARPKLHAITYSNTIDIKLSASLGSAELHGIFPIMVGSGVEASWAYGLSVMANMVRSYIFNHTAPEDIVLFFDAGDVIFQGGEEDIVNGYLELERTTGKSLIYHAEKQCSSSRKLEFPNVSSPWRYLNCGLYIGRSQAMRHLYREPLPSPLLDSSGRPQRLQNWHIDYYLSYPNSALDTNCVLMQAVDNIDGLMSPSFYPELKGLAVVDGKLHNTITRTVPSILHFPGSGHWPDWKHPLRVATCPFYELFRTTGHPNLAKLYEKATNHQKFFGRQPWKEQCSSVTTKFDQFAMQMAFFGDYLGACTSPRLTIFAIFGASLFILCIVFPSYIAVHSCTVVPLRCRRCKNIFCWQHLRVVFDAEAVVPDVKSV